MPPQLLSVALVLKWNLVSICMFLSPAGFAPLLTSERLPRRDLYMAHPWLMWANLVPDILICFSYLLFFPGVSLVARRMKDIEELRSWVWVFNSFRIFVLSSGCMVFLRVLYIWFPVYQLAMGLKLICALASVPTAIIFARRAPFMSASIRRSFSLLATEQLQSDSLRKSQEFLDRTGKIAGIGGWEVDLEANQVTWSTQTYRIHGASLDYKPTLEEGIRMYTPEARPAVIAAVLSASAGGPGWDLELPLIRMDGQLIMVRCVGEADFRDGKAVRLLGTFQDITAQVAARKSLQNATERVTLATNSGGIGIWDFDVVNQLLICDPWMFRLHGKDPKKLLLPGELWRDHLHPEDRAYVEQSLADAIDGVEDYSTEFRVIWEDGSVHTLRGTATVSRDDDGRPLRMVGANWDVTESRRLTAQLAEQHDLLRVTLMSIGDGVITTDVNRNVSWLNPVAERMTGWNTAEACGHPLTAIFNTFNAETRAPTDNPVANYIAQGNVVGVAKQTVLISRQGTEYGIENQAAPIRNNNGEMIGNILVFRDVTEQRRLAAETEHVTRLRLELKTKDEFLSHVSHELRSPLASIYSFSSIIADGLAGKTTPEQKDYLQIILKNVVQLQSMIEDLLTVTQSREGKLSIELQSESAADAIEDALHTLRSAASTKHIDLSADNLDDLPTVCADPTRLRQVLIILLDNAIKFTPPGGRVTVGAVVKEVGFLHFQVVDTGCGIPEEKRTRVFENLYQITGPSAPDTGQQGRIGLGLGLHIARNLVTRQGGYIWVTSAPDGGSVFSFTLPVYAAAEVALGDPAAGTPRRRKTDIPQPGRAKLLPAA